MSNSIAPGSSADVNVRVTALTTNPNVPVTYKTVILKKNLVNGVNTLTQEMISATNTKYVIKYDYVLGDDITVPENCILKFDGGSISGAYTLTGTNTGIETIFNSILGTNIIFAGTWILKKIIADWFIADDDCDMIQAAVNFANKISSGFGGYPDYTFVTIECLNRIYNVTKSIYIPMTVSLNGNGCTFKIAQSLTEHYLFICNADENLQTISATPGNIEVELCNFRCSNINNYNFYMCYCADSRKIHDIHAGYTNKVIIYPTSEYIDCRHIYNIVSHAINSTLPTVTSIADIRNNPTIRIGLGDNLCVENVAIAGSMHITSAACGSVKDCMIPYIAVDTPFITIDGLHTEGGGQIYFTKNLKVSNAHLWANANGHFIAVNEGSYAPRLILEKIIITRANKVAMDNLIIGNCYLYANQVLGTIGDAGYIDLGFLAGYLKYKGKPINPFEHKQFYDIVQNNIHYNWEVIKSNLAALSVTGTGSGNRVRWFILWDSDRQLIAPNLPYQEAYYQKGDDFYFFDYFGENSLGKLNGVNIRLELANNNNVYTRYLDFIPQSGVTFNITEENGNTITYNPDSYIVCNEYTLNGDTVIARLTQSTLPPTTNFKQFDRIFLNNGKEYSLVGNNWVDATGTPI